MKQFVRLISILFTFPAVAVASGEPCGLSGPVSERIRVCSQKKCAIGSWDEARLADCSKSPAEPGLNRWALVTRTQQGHEVWMDLSTNLIWSGDVYVPGDWATAEQACRTDIRNQGGLSAGAKGNLPIDFRLPSQADFATADAHGMRAVIPNIEAVVYWASTLTEPAIAIAFADVRFRTMSRKANDEYYQKLCVSSTIN